MNPLFPIVSNPDRPSPISAEQFGNVSADAAGLVLMEIIRERTSRGKRTYVVFLDVKQAFDMLQSRRTAPTNKDGTKWASPKSRLEFLKPC
jgi:hypothetical protein